MVQVKLVPFFIFNQIYCSFLKMLSTIPIFIVARGNNDKKIKKNKCALKFSFINIKKMGLINQTYIVSDNQLMLDFAKRLGFTNTIYRQCNNDKELKYLEYISLYEFNKKYKLDPDWFMILSIDELFLNTKLIMDCIKNIEYKYDVVTSYTEISNRSHFFLNDKGELDRGVHRITNEKDRKKMADAAIYAIKTKFANECMMADDPAVHFWEGKFKFFQNASIYTDINDSGDIQKFSYIGEIIQEVKQLNDSLNKEDFCTT